MLYELSNLDNIGIALKSLREDRGMTLTKLCEIVHMAPCTLHRIENGERPPSIRVIKAVTEALGLRVSIEFEDDTLAGFEVDEEDEKICEYCGLPNYSPTCSFCGTLQEKK